MWTKLSAVIVSVVTLTADLGSPDQHRQAAVIVEADALPGCAGLDCPPWPTPLDFDVCVRIDQHFYPGMRRPVSVKADLSFFFLLPCFFFFQIIPIEPSRLCRHPSIRTPC